jgi:hypothetical protein
MKRISIYLILWTTILTLVLTSCSANGTSKLEEQTPEADHAASVPAIELVPYASDAAEMETVVPQNWSEVRRGVSVQFKPAGELPLLSIEFYDHALEGMLLYYYSREFMLPELPSSIGKRHTNALDWNLYTFKAQDSTGNVMAWDLATAQVGPALYITILGTPVNEHDALYEQVFLPVVDALKPVPVVKRDKATLEELTASGYPDAGPINNDYFIPIGEYGRAIIDFEGTLSVPGFTMGFKGLNGNPPGTGQDRFPGFSAQFFTHDGFLVPVQQEILPGLNPDSFWNIILSPGKVWSEPGDGGMSRTVFPFVLVSTEINETHNGLATFLYNEAHVSSLRLQIVQETASWNRFDAWGQQPMSYTPGLIENREILEEQFTEELATQLPIHPWSELEQGRDSTVLNTFTGEVYPLHISATGVILDNAIYMQPSYTRYGEFPFPATMRHGAYSLTKSLGAAIAMLRLAEKYGEWVFDLKIKDYVTLTASHDGWSEVTFGDALNQATGIGDDPSLMVKDITSEESQPKWLMFTQARSAQEKLDVISTYGKYPWGSGEVVRYNSTNVFVLSVAMDRFLKSREGPQADIWDMVLKEVYEPIGIFHAPIQRTVEPNQSRGVPIFGYGLYPTPQEVAKVAMLLRNGGSYLGQQLLHAGKLAEALQHVEATGLPNSVINACGEGRYHLSFWAIPYCSVSGEKFMIPYMSGFGGNMVVFNPNGIVSFRFADAGSYGLDQLVAVAEAIKPFPTRSGQ